MTIVDLIKDLIDSSKERLKTPISGAFICSFLIYNWRPLAELLFSKMAIEDRIYVIDQEYCNRYAIIFPLIIALIYTVGVPFLMVIIDKVLVYAKEQRLENIYTSKGTEVVLKTKLASKILDLKNAESGNKEKQDFLDQIEELKAINSQTKTVHRNNMQQVTNNLEEANTTIKNLRLDNEKYNELLRNKVNSEIDNHDMASILNVLNGLNEEERKFLADIIFKGDIPFLQDVKPSTLKSLLQAGALFVEDDKIKISDFGKKLHSYIQNS